MGVEGHEAGCSPSRGRDLPGTVGLQAAAEQSPLPPTPLPPAPGLSPGVVESLHVLGMRSPNSPDALPAPCPVSLPHLGSCPSPAWLRGATAMTGAVHMRYFTAGDIFYCILKDEAGSGRHYFSSLFVIHSAFLCRMGGQLGPSNVGGRGERGVTGKKLGPGGPEVDTGCWMDCGLWGRFLVWGSERAGGWGREIWKLPQGPLSKHLGCLRTDQVKVCHLCDTATQEVVGGAPDMARRWSQGVWTICLSTCGPRNHSPGSWMTCMFLGSTPTHGMMLVGLGICI